MATTRSFSSMLNDYLANDLLKEEFVKRDYVLRTIDKDDGWVGASATSNEGAYIVPFKASGASSVAFGALSSSSDIAEDIYVRGRVTTQKEAWGSMVFNHRDIMEHDKVSEKNFLKLLPDAIEDFLDYMKNVVSVCLLNQWVCTVTADSTANTGNITVDRPDRLMIGQKLIIQDPVLVSSFTGYVKSIDMNTLVVNVVTTRGGSTVVDFSAAGGGSGAGVLAANSPRCYQDGAQTAASTFESLRSLMLSSANGGGSTIYGVTKTTYPYCQAINVSGASISAANIVDKIFDSLVTVRQFGKGNPTEVIMSYKNLGSCMKVIEAQKGAFNVKPGSEKANEYGWMEIQVGSPTKGGLKLVGVQEIDDDVMFIVDWRALKFASNGFFRKRKSPDGIEYFETRNTTGYTYIVDVCLFGELILHRPSYCGVIYSISY